MYFKQTNSNTWISYSLNFRIYALPNQTDQELEFYLKNADRKPCNQ